VQNSRPTVAYIKTHYTQINDVMMSVTGWSKKVSGYQESSLYRIKTVYDATFFISFEYKMSTRT